MGDEPWETQGEATEATHALPSQLCLRGDSGISKPGHVAAPRGPKRDWGVGQPGPASFQLCDERQAPRCSSPPAPEWPFRGTDRIRSPPRVREKLGPDHLAQSLVTMNARDIGAQKGSSEERHRHGTVTSKTVRTALGGKASINPGTAVLPSHYFSLSLQLLPRTQTACWKCHLRGALAPTGGGAGRASAVRTAVPPTSFPPSTALHRDTPHAPAFSLSSSLSCSISNKELFDHITHITPCLPRARESSDTGRLTTPCRLYFPSSRIFPTLNASSQ